MTNDKNPSRATPSTETTGEIPRVPESAAHALTGATALIRQDGTSEINTTEPHIISNRSMARKLRDPNKILTQLVGQKLAVSSAAHPTGVGSGINTAATAIVRTFDPQASPIYGDALFTYTDGKTHTSMEPAEATLIMDAVTELDELTASGHTPSPSVETRTKLLQEFDRLRAAPSEFEAFGDEPGDEPLEQPDESKANDSKLPWTIAGGLALLTVVLGAILLFPSSSSDDTQAEEDQTPVTETLTEEAPEDERQPYDASRDIENFDKNKELDERSKELDDRSTALDEREQEIANRESQAQARSEQLDQREIDIAQQEDSLREHQDRLDQAIAQFNEMQREAENNPETPQDSDVSEDIRNALDDLLNRSEDGNQE